MADLSVLIVDDNADMRALVRTILEIEGVPVVGEATSVGRAVSDWRAHHPDLVVMDFRMEDGTGLDAAREILSDDPSASIILFSAFLTDENIAEAAELGVSECVSKDDLRRLASLVHVHA